MCCSTRGQTTATLANYESATVIWTWKGAYSHKKQPIQEQGFTVASTYTRASLDCHRVTLIFTENVTGSKACTICTKVCMHKGSYKVAAFMRHYKLSSVSATHKECQINVAQRIKKSRLVAPSKDSETEPWQTQSSLVLTSWVHRAVANISSPIYVLQGS